MGGAAAAPYLAAALGGGMGSLGAIFAPEGQELSSFEEYNPEIDPRAQATDLNKYLSAYLNMALDEAREPVTSSTVVKPLPSFSGGGLPFDISAPAVDPHRQIASLRTLEPSGGQLSPWPSPDELNRRPGTTPRRPVPRPPASGGGGGGTGGGEPSRPALPRPDGGQAAMFAPAEEDSGSYDLSQFSGGEPSDLDQAEGAIELLLQQLGRG